jgi:hypothetical protein
VKILSKCDADIFANCELTSKKVRERRSCLLPGRHSSDVIQCRNWAKFSELLHLQIKKEKNSITSDQKNSPEIHIFLLKRIKVEQNKEIFTTDDCKFTRREKKIKRRKLSLSLSLSLSKLNIQNLQRHNKKIHLEILVFT